MALTSIYYLSSYMDTPCGHKAHGTGYSRDRLGARDIFPSCGVAVRYNADTNCWLMLQREQSAFTSSFSGWMTTDTERVSTVSIETRTGDWGYSRSSVIMNTVN